uniref:Uncharacterized protein n=1 Tax=Oryza meridionalis TaxID=40149 RepID=A0A0E0C1K7_9ORYZ
MTFATLDLPCGC